MTPTSKNEKGICLISYGQKADKASQACWTSIRDTCALPIIICSETEEQRLEEERTTGYTDAQKARLAKVSLLDWSPYELTCYIDADTTVRGDLEIGFKVLQAGWDMAIVPSRQQGDDLLWHVGTEERLHTINRLGTNHILQLQCGVLWFNRSERIKHLFALWKEEWLMYEQEDQGAFLRALARAPARVWLLGHPFNGGAVIDHHWGMTR